MDRTQRPREPEQEMNEILLNACFKDEPIIQTNFLFLPLVLWCSVVLRFNFSVLSEEIATRTKGKKAGRGLNHRGHRGRRERQFDFPLCALCPLWLALLQWLPLLCFRFGRAVITRPRTSDIGHRTKRLMIWLRARWFRRLRHQCLGRVRCSSARRGRERSGW